jgi:hypothetical protein
LKKVKSLGIKSVFRVSHLLGAVEGALVGLVLMIADFLDNPPRVLEGIVTLVLAPVLYGLIGAVINALMAWIYNRVADRLGGIEVEIE